MAEVRGTKELLDNQELIDYIASVEVIKDSFTPEGESASRGYNYMVIAFANGDSLRVKMDKLTKQTVFYVLKDGKKAV